MIYQLYQKIYHHYSQIKKGGIKILFKKIFIVFNIVINLPFYFIGFFILLILFLLKPLFLIRIGRLRSEKLGHLSEEYEIFLSEKRLNINQPRKKHIDIFFREKTICNSYYYHLRKKEFLILPRVLLFPLYKIIIILGCKKTFICDREHAAMDTFYSLDNSKSTIVIDEDLKNESLQVLKKKGLKEDQKIICLHLRDSSYRGLNNSNDFRNIKNINRYIKSIKYLTQKGYFVIRTGVITKNEINFEHVNFFDYSKSDIRSEKMDVFLAASCYFCIANGSGFEPMVRSFRNPVLYTNFNKYDCYKSQHIKDMTIFLHYVDLKSNKKLSLNEIFERGLFTIQNDSQILESNIFLEENSEDEILEAVQEMINRLEGKWQISEDAIILDTKFKKFYNEKIRIANNFNPFVNIRSQIPSSYLINNKHLVDF